MMTKILGIVNVTRDSFSDGGKFLSADKAHNHARRLIADGADVIDLGAESTHPDAEDVPANLEISRLDQVIRRLRSEGASISVDTYKPAVMRHVTALGVDYINDVTALRDAEAVAAIRESSTRLILMHSRAPQARARREESDAAGIMDEILRFFEERITTLTAAGIAPERLILDPGMGFFLGSNPESSLAVLRNLDRLRRFKLPILVSTSKKSFIGTLLGTLEKPRPTQERGAGTLMTEIWAALNGAEYIRTHEVKPLRDALAILAKLRGANEAEKSRLLSESGNIT